MGMVPGSDRGEKRLVAAPHDLQGNVSNHFLALPMGLHCRAQSCIHLGLRGPPLPLAET